MDRRKRIGSLSLSASNKRRRFQKQYSCCNFCYCNFALYALPEAQLMTSLSQWLDSIGLGKYAEAFKKHSVDWDVLEKLNHSLLKDIGVISAGDRIRLLNAIKELASQDDKRTETTTIREISALSAGSDDAQRRQLTVLFCDIVGYTLGTATNVECSDARLLPDFRAGEGQQEAGRSRASRPP